MKKRLHFGRAGALLTALALLLTACGNIGVITGEDGPTGIYVGGNTFTIDDESGAEGKPDESGGRLDRVPEEDPGTTDGEGELPYGDVRAPEEEAEAVLDEDGTYNSAEDVSLYLHTYRHLPSNYITKSEAEELGWTGGPVEKYAPGCAIGGDKFGNREGNLPAGNYHECDIDTIGASGRGAKRIVYSDDGRIYYTDDHYATFTLLYGEE